jgi:tRNA(fMet)-specific endonuclease VapC
MPYLLDTNICIYLIKRRPLEVVQRFADLSVGDLSISAITLYELAYGAWKSAYVDKSLQALSQFVTPLVVLPFDAEDAREAGRIRATLAQAGQPIGPL